MIEAPKVRCRQIVEEDFAGLADLLLLAFVSYSPSFWMAAFAHLKERQSPEGYPRYGFMLESDGVPVGVILTIFNEHKDQGVSKIRCNVSSWYVMPDHRGHGSFMMSKVFKYKDVTILNTSALPHTWPILERHGYKRYSDGQIICLPALNFGERARVRLFQSSDAARLGDDQEAALMAYHASRGAIALVCETAQEIIPLIFFRRKLFSLRLPYAQLAYCRDSRDFTRFAGSIGRWLALRGYAVTVLDAAGPDPELGGRFLKNRIPKFYKGADKPRLNDLAYTEAIVLGTWRRRA